MSETCHDDVAHPVSCTLLQKRVDCTRLKARKHFVALRDYDHKVVTPLFILQYAPIAALVPSVHLPPPHACAIGFTVTKRLGNAVRRNRIKRRLKAMVDEVMPPYACAGYAYVVIGRHTAHDADFTELLGHGKYAFKRVMRQANQQ
jgi:ribonuclease P protein component